METDLLGLWIVVTIMAIVTGLFPSVVEQNSSHIVGPDCNWCPWDRTRHNESHPEKWNGIGVSIRGSVHAKVVEVEWVFSSGIVA
jgi:hypothetical protein